MKELIELIAHNLVAHPEAVEVTESELNGEQVYSLRVHQEDMGRIIGKSGRTAKAIRQLVSSSASKNNIQVVLEIVE